MSTLYVDNLQPNLGSQVEIPQLKPLAGSVVQVVSVTKTDTFSISGATFTDIADLSVSITPTSATNKILVVASVSASASSGQYIGILRFVRDSTAIGIGDTASSRPSVTTAFRSDTDNSWQQSHSLSFLDSPATTSATTYKIQGASQTGGTFYVNRSPQDGDTQSGPRSVSTITVMEIAQ